MYIRERRLQIVARVQMLLVSSEAFSSKYEHAHGSFADVFLCVSGMLQVGEYDSSSGTFHFAKGGFQGARGNDKGDNFYIENVFEELDAPGEFYYDPMGKKLYLW